VTEDGKPGSGPTLQQLAHALSQTEHRVSRELGRLLEGGGCTLEQWRALELLADGRGHPMSELAEFALLPAPTLTRLVDRMVADNLAYRRADPADGRRVLVRITARGRRLHERVGLELEARAEEVVAGAAAELSRLTAVLLALRADLRR
jgi:DNA-binding MarR family transcriptional regulator